MKLMHSEWQDRVKHWVRTLRDDFYEPLGKIRWEAFRTMDHLSPEEALQGHFTSAEPGFIWGKTWEYCWFKGTVILPKAAEGKRIVMNLDAGGESTVFVNGKAFGNYRAAWVDEPHQFIEDNCLAVSGKEGDTYEILMGAARRDRCCRGHMQIRKKKGQDVFWVLPLLGCGTKMHISCLWMWIHWDVFWKRWIPQHCVLRKLQKH